MKERRCNAELVQGPHAGEYRNLSRNEDGMAKVDVGETVGEAGGDVSHSAAPEKWKWPIMIKIE